MKFRKRRKTRDRSQERLLSTCAWCGTRIPEDTEVFTFSAKVNPGVDLKGDEGSVIPLTLRIPGKIVPAIVPTADSPAKKEGKDLLFMICGDDCGTALRQALEREISLAD
ncbi:MAG TPA: hypothetical protein VLM38_11440 [Blastocatellia bacterium]|nr:hypothetical protein [Blastocatellia bacterium]